MTGEHAEQAASLLRERWYRRYQPWARGTQAAFVRIPGRERPEDEEALNQARALGIDHLVFEVEFVCPEGEE